MPKTCPRPIAVKNLRCRRCRGTAFVCVPLTGRVLCVDCAAARCVRRLARAVSR